MRFQQVNMVVVVKSLKSCPTLATTWTVACQVPLSVGFPSQKYWSGLPFPSPVDLSDPGTEPVSPASQAGSLPPCVCMLSRFSHV